MWNAFSGGGGRFHAGHWQAEPGRIAVDYTETELCVLLVGRVRLTDESGASMDFGPGDAFVIDAGFKGTWESIGRVTKIYAILEPGDGEVRDGERVWKAYRIRMAPERVRIAP